MLHASALDRDTEHAIGTRLPAVKLLRPRSSILGKEEHSRVHCRTVRLRELSDRDERAWRDLALRAAEPNPFMEPDCLVPASLHQPFGAEMEVVLAESEGRAYACIPVRAVRRQHRFLGPFLTTQVRCTIECGTPLVDAERGVEALAAIFLALSERRKITKSRVLVIPKVSADGPVFEALQTAARIAGFPFVVYDSWERGLLKRGPDPGYERSFNAHQRRSLRRMRRRLEEELGTEPHLVDQTSDPAAVERFLRLEGSGYKAKTGVAMVTQTGEADLFRDLCRRFAATGRLHIFGLVAGGRTVAMEVWLRGGDGLFRFRTGYDERYARHGPGLQLQVAAMEHFHVATDASWIDTCTGRDNEMALRLYPDRRRAALIFVPLSKNPLDWAVLRSLKALRPAHQWAYHRLHPAQVLKGTGRRLPPA